MFPKYHKLCNQRPLKPTIVFLTLALGLFPIAETSIAQQSAEPTQVSTGLIPHETGMSGAYDTINLADLGIMLRVPLRSKPAPAPFNFALVAQTTLSPTGAELDSSGRPTIGQWTPVPNAGSASFFASDSYTLFPSTSPNTVLYTTCPSGSSTTLYTNFSLTDATGAARQLHAVFQRLSLRLQPGKGRQQRRMNIENALWKSLHKIGRKQPHVAGQANQIDPLLLQNGYHLAVVSLTFEAFRRQHVRQQSASFGPFDSRSVRTIADDHRDSRAGDGAGTHGVGERLEIRAAPA